jgi:antitoxin PrlF
MFPFDQVRIFPCNAEKEIVMTNVFKEVSTITAKGQTTVPKSVRQALGLDYGDRIAFYVDDQRGVSVLREAVNASDPRGR